MSIDNGKINLDNEAMQLIESLSSVSDLEITSLESIEDIKQLIINTKATIISLKSQIETSNAQIEYYKKQIETLKTTNSIALRVSSGMVKEYQKQVAILKKQIEASNTQIDEYKKQVHFLRTQLESTNNKVEEYKKQVDQIKTSNAVALKVSGEMLEEYKNHVNSLRFQLDELRCEVKKIQTDKDIDNKYQKYFIDNPEGATRAEVIEKISIDREKAAAHREKIMANKAALEIKNILVIAYHGIISQQIKFILAKFGCKVTMIKDYESAVTELVQESYDCIIYDLLTLNNEDYLSIESLRKSADISSENTLILTLVPSQKNKKDHKKIRDKGADIVVEKIDSWHVNIVKELNLTYWEQSNKLGAC